MTKANEPLLDPEATTGRFYVMVDENVDPTDWDRAVAQFLLAGLAGGASASVTAERASLGISAWEQAEHSEPIFVASPLHRSRDVVLMKESAVVFDTESTYWPRPCFATERRIHG